MPMSATPTKAEVIDLFWRSVWTFIASFLGAFPGAALVVFLSNISNGDAHISVNGIWIIIAPAIYAACNAVVTLVKVYVSNKLGTGTATSRDAPVAGLVKPVATVSIAPAP